MKLLNKRYVTALALTITVFALQGCGKTLPKKAAAAPDKSKTTTTTNDSSLDGAPDGDGKTSPTGLAQVLNNLPGCDKPPVDVSGSVDARNLVGDEAKNLVLPYEPAGNNFATVGLGEGNKTAADHPYNVNAQVVFALDLASLPPVKFVQAVKSLKLTLSFYKATQDQKVRSELICMLDQGLCSGHRLQDKASIAQYDKKAFWLNRMIDNPIFSDEIHKSTPTSPMAGAFLYTFDNWSMEISDLFQNSFQAPSTPNGDLFSRDPAVKYPSLGTLYNNSVVDDAHSDVNPDKQMLKKTLKFAVATDIVVTKASISYTLSLSACPKDSKTTPTTPPATNTNTTPIIPDDLQQ